MTRAGLYSCIGGSEAARQAGAGRGCGRTSVRYSTTTSTNASCGQAVNLPQPQVSLTAAQGLQAQPAGVQQLPRQRRAPTNTKMGGASGVMRQPRDREWRASACAPPSDVCGVCDVWRALCPASVCGANASPGTALHDPGGQQQLLRAALPAPPCLPPMRTMVSGSVQEDRVGYTARCRSAGPRPPHSWRT